MMLGTLVLISMVALGRSFPQQSYNEEPTEQAEGPGLRCGYNTCGANAICGKTNGFDDCICKPGFFGSGFGDGCTSEPQCIDDSACKDDEYCGDRNLCQSSCLFKCPADAGCMAKNHRAECILDGQLFFEYPTAEAPTTEAPADTEAPHH